MKLCSFMSRTEGPASQFPSGSSGALSGVHIKPGETVEIEFELAREHLSLIDNDGRRLLEPGAFRIYVGGQQPDDRSRRSRVSKS